MISEKQDKRKQNGKATAQITGDSHAQIVVFLGEDAKAVSGRMIAKQGKKQRCQPQKPDATQRCDFGCGEKSCLRTGERQQSHGADQKRNESKPNGFQIIKDGVAIEGNMLPVFHDGGFIGQRFKAKRTFGIVAHDGAAARALFHEA